MPTVPPPIFIERKNSRRGDSELYFRRFSRGVAKVTKNQRKNTPPGILFPMKEATKRKERLKMARKKQQSKGKRSLGSSWKTNRIE